jgi:hypothetical protein
MGQIARGVASVLTDIFPRSSVFLRVISLINFVAQLTAILQAGSHVSCQHFLSLRLCVNIRFRPEFSLFMFQSVTFLIASLYAERPRHSSSG